MGSLLVLAKEIVAETAVEVLDSEFSITALGDAIVREVAGFEEGQAFSILEARECRAAVFPLAIEEGQIVERHNPIWTNPRFVLPMIAKLAQFFAATLDPRGEACFDVKLEKDEESLYGYELADISVADEGRFERDVFALMLAGAAKSFLTDADGRTLAMWAVRKI